jgi:hypothetical protein
MTRPDCPYTTLSHFSRFFKGVRGIPRWLNNTPSSVARFHVYKRREQQPLAVLQLFRRQEPPEQRVALERIDRFEEFAARLLVANSGNTASDGTSD